ncbi:cleavage stimulation factor subunit 77 isoform X2 [Cucumis melo var. makuwa]|uniref:Cleavage stimulation factor subunit 77 isoform X2 n=1 Tax=Cucumis melo var. makuwa TaxID=1194695 RepID=A0A5A7TEI5_CUCMM|nr:cleavage stimulation factor subunit 77 isoform X2 [Cucumis melo var. makuwa]
MRKEGFLRHVGAHYFSRIFRGGWEALREVWLCVRLTPSLCPYVLSFFIGKEDCCWVDAFGKKKGKKGDKTTSNKLLDGLKYNVEVAESVATEAQRLPILEATPLYEQLLTVYPTAAKYWKQYVEAHMVVNNDDATRQIFSRCLLNCLHIPLWYDRCFTILTSVDISSGPVWMEYIAFLKSLPALSSQEESHRMTAVRKVYQKAIITPTHHIEQLWRDYENFENSVSRQLAMSEYQPKFNSARAVYRERKKYVDEIDCNMLAVPPTGSPKEELQWMSWRRLIAFEKGNPQRIDSASSNKRIIFTYEQCLMYLYHYPDVWYDYALWHASNGSIDAAIKVFQRALKALPDSDMLKYAYAELEESRGSLQAWSPDFPQHFAAKKIYESLLSDGVNATALAHIQFIRFLRRNEGVEAARKHFLDARKSPNCTYHVYVAYAMMAFCLDKDPKIAHNVFEDGMKRFMNESTYILEYADFLARLNDDRNIRALFERALSTLPLEESAEVWKRFIHFEQTYGDLASMLKVEKRRKEALSQMGEDGASTLESSLQDVVSRYSFMDLWPCTSSDLDNLTRQEWLAKNISKNSEKSSLPGGTGFLDTGSAGFVSHSIPSTKVVYPDTSQMVIYDPSQILGILPTATTSGLPANPSNPVSVASGAPTNVFDEILKATPAALIAFLANLPAVDVTAYPWSQPCSPVVETSRTHRRPMPPLLSWSTPTCLPKSSHDTLLQPHVHGTGIDQVHKKSRFEVGESSTQSKPTDLPMYSKNPLTSFPNLSSGAFPREKLNGQNYFSWSQLIKMFLDGRHQFDFLTGRLSFPYPKQVYDCKQGTLDVTSCFNRLSTLVRDGLVQRDSLNPKFDIVCGLILGQRPLPSLMKVCCKVRLEVDRTKAMSVPTTLETVPIHPLLYEPLLNKITITNGCLASIARKGQIFPFAELFLQNALHVPKIPYNLLFVSKITCELNYKATSLPEFVSCHYLSSGRMIGTARHSRGLYLLDDDTSATSAKQHQVSFISQPYKTSQLFTLIHSDNFYHTIEMQFNAKKLILRSDNGREFENHTLSEFLASKGIVHQSLCAYAPQQNGLISSIGCLLVSFTFSSLRLSQGVWGYKCFQPPFRYFVAVDKTFCENWPFFPVSHLLGENVNEDSNYTLESTNPTSTILPISDPHLMVLPTNQVHWKTYYRRNLVKEIVSPID